MPDISEIQSEINYKQIVDDALDAFWLADTDSKLIINVNNAYCQITGYSKDEIIGKKITDFEIAESNQEVDIRMAAIARDGSCTFIGTHKTKKDSIVKLEVTARLAKIGDKTYVCAFMKNLGNSIMQETYGAIVSTLHANHISAWKWDMESDIVEWDDLTFEMLGYNHQAFKINYSAWLSMLHPEDASKADDEVKKQLLSGDHFVIEFRARKSDGTWLWLEGRGKVIKYNSHNIPLLAVGTHADISHRKAVETELAINQEKLRILNTQLKEMVKLETQKRISKELAFSSIFELFGTGILILDENLKIVDANKQFLSMYDIESKKNILGLSYIEILDEKDRYSATERLEKIIADTKKYGCFCQIGNEQARNSNIQYEVSINTKNSKQLNLLINSTYFKSSNNTTNYIFSITDITAMRALESRQKEAEKLLIVQSRMAAMGEMIGAIAHQWRQPLNLLGIMIQDIPYSFKNGEINQDYADKFSRNAMEQIYFMSKTIDDFRNFFRSDKSLKDFYLSKHTRNSLSLVSDMFKAHTIDIDIKELSSPIVRGYPNELSQVILNIVANAKDALDLLPGTVPHNITVTIFENDSYGIVEIADNAGGIPENIIDRVFEPYFTTKEEGKGTGIGLYMSKTIVEVNMNGHLSVKNNNDGAIFTIKIPLAID